MIIIGNGGLKDTRTFNEDPVLNTHARRLDMMDRLLHDRIVLGEANMDATGNPPRITGHLTMEFTR